MGRCKAMSNEGSPAGMTVQWLVPLRQPYVRLRRKRDLAWNSVGLWCGPR